MKTDLLFEKDNSCGCKVLVYKGTLASPTGIDFITRYFDPATCTRPRTPKHEHIVADILTKAQNYPGALLDMISYFKYLLVSLQPAAVYPKVTDIGKINLELRNKLISLISGKHLFHIEDLLQIYELIMWQEVTRYPKGSLSSKILRLLEKPDLFAAVGLATLKKV